jgi:hypothetical protein
MITKTQEILESYYKERILTFQILRDVFLNTEVYEMAGKLALSRYEHYQCIASETIHLSGVTDEELLEIRNESREIYEITLLIEKWALFSEDQNMLIALRNDAVLKANYADQNRKIIQLLLGFQKRKITETVRILVANVLEINYHIARITGVSNILIPKPSGDKDQDTFIQIGKVLILVGGILMLVAVIGDVDWASLGFIPLLIGLGFRYGKV